MKGDIENMLYFNNANITECSSHKTASWLANISYSAKSTGKGTGKGTAKSKNWVLLIKAILQLLDTFAVNGNDKNLFW